MHLFFTLQISLFQNRQPCENAVVYLLWQRHFFFRFPNINSSIIKIKIIIKKGSPIVPGVFCTGYRQGEMHSHSSLENWRLYASIINFLPSWSILCVCTDLCSSTLCITTECREQNLPFIEVIKYHAKRRVTPRTTIVPDIIVKFSQVLRLTNNLFVKFHLFVLKMFKRRCWIYSWHFPPVDNHLHKHGMNIHCSNLKIWIVS